MLWLKRNQRFNELYKCGISDELIGPGDYYYEDDEDGLLVKATVYKRMLDEKRRNEFDYSKINMATSQEEYRKLLARATMEFNTQGLFDRKIAGKEG